MWNLKKYNQLVNITKRSRLTEIQNKLVVTTGERGGGEGQDKAGIVGGTNY